MTTICGQVYVLGDHVDTDQILTAEFMKINPATAEGYQQLGALALCGLPDSYPPFINPDTGKARYPILVAGENFGCGSSREHAPIALGSAGVQAVIAQSFARIFFRNCIATGELLPIELRERLCDRVQTGDEIEIVLDQQQVRVPQVGDLRIQPLGALVEVVAAGGLFAYARQIGKIPVL